MDPRTAPPPGTLVEGWHLDERIGSGSYGVVYRAHRPGTGLSRAVKMVLVGTEHDARLWHAEYQGLDRLEHRNIVRLYDAEPVQQGPWTGWGLVVTELCARSLDDVLGHQRRTTLSPGRARDLLLAMLDALAYAQRQDVVHRDLKPGNIFETRDGVWKLGDWGTVRESGTAGGPAAGGIAGTRSYMSATAFGGRQGHAEDLYALGVTVHEALTGRVLHEDLPPPTGDVREDFAACRRHVERHPPNVSMGLPPWWQDVIRRLIALDPATTAAAIRRHVQRTGGGARAGGARGGASGGGASAGASAATAWTERDRRRGPVATDLLPDPPVPPRPGPAPRPRRPRAPLPRPRLPQVHLPRPRLLSSGWKPAQAHVNGVGPPGSYTLAATAAAAAVTAEWLAGSPAGALADGGRDPLGAWIERGTTVAAGGGVTLLVVGAVLAAVLALLRATPLARATASAATAGGAWAAAWRAQDVDWIVDAPPLSQAALALYALALLASLVSVLRPYR